MDGTTAIVVCLFGVLIAAIALASIIRGGSRNTAGNGSQIVTAPAASPFHVYTGNGGWTRAAEIQALENATANVVRAKIELETARHLRAVAADGRYNGDLAGTLAQYEDEAHDAVQAALEHLVTARAGERDSAPADIENIDGKIAGSGNGHEA